MIITLTGPSCAGKSTLEKALKAKGFAGAISTTTRPRREGEKSGEAYYFVERCMFEEQMLMNKFIEAIEFSGNMYGVEVREVESLLAQGKPVVIVCEPTGQKQIAAYCVERGWSTRAVFVNNPTSVITERFLDRFMSEASFATDDEAGRLLSIYSSRLATMMTVERRWIAEAYGSDVYDIVLDAFDSDSRDTVVQMIIDSISDSEAA